MYYFETTTGTEYLPPSTHIHFLLESRGLFGNAFSALFNRNSISPSSVSHLTVILFDTCILLLGYEFTSSSPLCTQHWEVSHFIHDILLESRISQASGKMFNEHLLSERFTFPKRKKKSLISHFLQLLVQQRNRLNSKQMQL